jgi:sec-independent protein translocase protein TatA
MFGLGPSELLIILILVLFFYGGKRLPQIGDGVGRGIREFKRAIRAVEKTPAASQAPVAKESESGRPGSDQS